MNGRPAVGRVLWLGVMPRNARAGDRWEDGNGTTWTMVLLFGVPRWASPWGTLRAPAPGWVEPEPK